MTSQAEIGLIGLGVMGRNLALNIAERGFAIAVHNRTPSRTEAFGASDEARDKRVIPSLTLEEFVAASRRPRAISLWCRPARRPTSRSRRFAAPGAGDVLMDGGNALFRDTIRRERALREKGILFLGTGSRAARRARATAPRSWRAATSAYERVRPVLERSRPWSTPSPACALSGPMAPGISSR